MATETVPRRRSTNASLADAALKAVRDAPASHQRIAAALMEALAARDPSGQAVARIHGLTQVADLAAQQIVDASDTWVEHLGSFYDGEAVRQLLGQPGEPVSRQAVHKRKGLLALTTGSGQVVYPCAQFRGRQLAPGLADVLNVLPEAIVSRWTVASWLVTSDADLDGQRPLDVLFEGGPEGRTAVLAAASHWAAALRG